MQYIAILRGINVSGKNILKMTELKKMMEDLSFNNVQTYIQSGNIVFESNKKDSTKLEDLIAESIEDAFSLKVPVIVLSKERLASIIAMNPYKDYPDLSKIFYTFLKNKPLVDFNTIKSEIADKIGENEEIHFTNEAVYVYCANGYGNTNLHNILIEKKLKVIASTRNYKTTHHLFEM